MTTHYLGTVRLELGHLSVQARCAQDQGTYNYTGDEYTTTPNRVTCQHCRERMEQDFEQLFQRMVSNIQQRNREERDRRVREAAERLGHEQQPAASGS